MYEPQAKYHNTWFRLLKQICKALDFGQRELDIVHKDIKPDNILLDSQNNPTDAQVCDYGIAIFQSNDETYNETMAGTFNYNPPELFRWQQGNYSLKHFKKDDSWRVGCVIYDLFVGDYAFT